ncbi:DUF4215 domain-containing protein [Pseudenhygromyxa sp. WMMC2535]|uniref:DUF4215 domain-containing protein n=1 Tax=Pseudenhygromyxa sp. WMMC2535 TaxID=2712867 RepID=UPI0020D00040|nr:DUF4215 domain-containing protein [Pseudenhygromyxa sp. WMMC2535]
MFSSPSPLIRSSLFLAGISAIALFPASAQAISPASHMHGRGDLELKPGAMAAARSGVEGHWLTPQPTSARGRAVASLEAALGGRVLTHFDADTGVLDTLLPNGTVVAGSMRSPVVAEDFARDFLSKQLALLAPGATPSDFVLVSDVVSGGVRSLGFAQTQAGMRVIGGQISFAFKADRLIAVRSTALPDMRAQFQARATTVDAGVAVERARAWIADDFAGGTRSAAQAERADVDGPLIFPVIHARDTISYREVLVVDVRLDSPRGHWQVYVDAGTGEPLARRSLMHWAELEMNVWARSPLGARTDMPARFLELTVGGQPAVTSGQGVFTVSASVAEVDAELDGLYAKVFDEAGSPAFYTNSFAPDSSFVWSGADDVGLDAQLNAYSHTQIVKARVLSIDDAFDVPLLETAVTVNIDDVCNAYADGNTINFFSSGSGCENTALLSDVVYHEYGHVAHRLGLIEGVGVFDGAVSEGISDYLSATIVNDAGVAKGFFLDTSEALRDLDPEGYEWHWPEDNGEIHAAGRIIGGALWDLRKSLIAKYGQAAGMAATDHIWLQSIRRATDMPSMYTEALIANDDDGNLQNGTPDLCEINAAFGAHGLLEIPEGGLAITSQFQADNSFSVTVEANTELFQQCGSSLEGAQLRYRVRPESGGSGTMVTEIDMQAAGEGTYVGQIPSQPDGTVIQYQLEIEWGGTALSRPANLGYPWYETYFGDVTEIWCSGFEDGGEGWTLGQDWDIGVPGGAGGDPDAAYTGQQVAGMVLDSPGIYGTWIASELVSPVIDVSGFDSVRLQYQRWLNIEDGFWDQAMILANGLPAWGNFASTDGVAATVHHTDQEWAFHDVDLSDFVDANGEMQLRFTHASDGGLEFGGWNIDGLCIVGIGDVPDPTGGDEGEDEGSGNLCGDGIVGEFEQCDDGNLVNGDGCSAGCLLEDEGGEDDVGDDGTGEGGAGADWDPDRGCGCDSAGEDPRRAALGGLALLGLVGLGRRRRRSRSR